MKTITLLCAVLMMFSVMPVQADAQPTAFEKALYDKARYDVLSHLNDDDFVSYCTTMNFGGDTLLKLHDDILVKQTELGALIKRGLTADNPQVISLNDALNNLRTQLAVKVSEARKGLEIESKVAEATISSLSQYQK
jgi:capsule polysaccharide export protein KpsE/RkpR